MIIAYITLERPSFPSTSKRYISNNHDQKFCCTKVHRTFAIFAGCQTKSNGRMPGSLVFFGVPNSLALVLSKGLNRRQEETTRRT